MPTRQLHAQVDRHPRRGLAAVRRPDCADVETVDSGRCRDLRRGREGPVANGRHQCRVVRVLPERSHPRDREARLGGRSHHPAGAEGQASDRGHRQCVPAQRRPQWTPTRCDDSPHRVSLRPDHADRHHYRDH